MSLVLNIDTTSGTALVNIAENGTVLLEETNEAQKDHAAFLQPAVLSVLKRTGIDIEKLDAIAVSHGPGSYTGIRVGMSSAKGLCYALNKPLITVSALEVLTKDAINNNEPVAVSKSFLFCPMIDARRMEVYTAIYDSNINPVLIPCALVLDESSYAKILLNNPVLFFGSGADKWQQLYKGKNAVFATIKNKGLAMSSLSYKKLQENNFADVAYAAPLYIKEFYTGAANN